MPSVEINDIRQPTELVCRQIVREMLTRALAAADRLANPDDAEALHDTRVAVRRLRTCLRAYRPWLQPMLGRKVYRQLKRITRQTNASRDAQVHLEWIDRQLHRKRTSARVRHGLERLRLGVREDLPEASPEQAMTIQQRLAKVARRMMTRLADRPFAPNKQHRPAESFAAASAGILSLLRDRLRSDFQRISPGEDQGPAHEARLTAKRIRYLLEPMKGPLPQAANITRDCKRLQDLIGALRDLQTLEHRACELAEREVMQWARARLHRAIEGDGRQLRIGMPGWQATIPLIRRLRREQTRLFGRLERQWLGRKSAEFLAMIDEVIAYLRGEEPAHEQPPLDEADDSILVQEDLFHAA